MDSFLGVENEQIGRHGPLEAVHLFRDLLWAEARRIGIAPEIRISERITTPDGGIDASASNAGVKASELIKSGYSGYQIKTGTAFALTESQLKKELFGQGNEPAKENLGSSVQRCLEAKGHLIFVCFGLDPVESQINAALDLIKDWLNTCGYPDAAVQIWGQTTIQGFLSDFFSLRLKVNGRGSGIFEILESWKIHADMKPDTLSLGEKQKAILEEVRSQLLANSEAVHLRIIGESGVGKTRLVLEALGDERLSSLVIYSDKPHELESQGFLGYLAMPDNRMEIILVLDECPFEDAGRFWNRLQGLGKRIRHVTIHNENHAQTGSTRVIILPPLEQSHVAEILRQYDIPPEHLSRWASFCGGSPRWAKIIGENIRNNSRDLLADPDTIPIVNRYIAGPDNPTDQAVRERILIIRFLSLFTKFGYRPPVSAEADAIYQLIHEYEPSISRARFDESIRNLHDRRILQGERTYYITPKPLQVRLWVEWWRNHSSAFDFEKFNNQPPLLVQGFNDMFRFAQESEAALQTVEHLLSAQGPFADGTLLRQERGGAFFLALTEGAPNKALERLEATVGSWSKKQLLQFKQGRGQVIWALERIAVWEGLFDRALRLLERLAEAENDDVYANNATGIFKDFFSVFAATEEPPLKRLPIVEELLHSKEAVKERLAIQAISIALENHFTRMVGSEYQGLRREPRLWLPTGDHGQEAYKYLTAVWNLLIEAQDCSDPENRKEAKMQLARQLQMRGRIPQSSQMALETARKVLNEKTLDRNILIEVIVHILHYGKNELAQELQRLWHDFYSELVPEDLSSLINRYVALDLLEDLFDTGSHSEEKRNQTIKQLAARAYDNLEVFRKELPWLVTERAANGYLFGYELGKLDRDRRLLPEILDARRSAPPDTHPSQYFLGGYLRALYEADVNAWNSLFSTLSKDKTFLPLAPELAWRGGVTNEIMEQLIILTESRSIDPLLMAPFKYGVEIRKLAESTFQRLVRSLLSHHNKRTASIALDIFARFYIDKDVPYELPRELTLDLIRDHIFFAVSEGYRDTMDQYYWTQVAGKYLDKFGEDKAAILSIGRLMLDSIGNEGSLLAHSDTAVRAILARISEKYPDEMWIHALTNIEKKGYFIFKHWLSSRDFFESDGETNLKILEKIKLDTLWRWIEKDVKNRAWFIAAMVPNSFDNTPGQVCLARELLLRYGDREDVRRNLAANFFSEGWAGKSSDHYRAKLAAIEPKRKMEAHPKVILWLDEYIARLKESIERSQIEEERDWA